MGSADLGDLPSGQSGSPDDPAGGLSIDPADLANVRRLRDAVREQVGRVVVGNQSAVDTMLLALMAGGHVLLDGVLCGHHHERLGKRYALAFEGHLTFLHGLQQGGLGFGRSAVDLICQQDLTKNGSFAEDKIA